MRESKAEYVVVNGCGENSLLGIIYDTEDGKVFITEKNAIINMKENIDIFATVNHQLQGKKIGTIDLKSMIMSSIAEANRIVEEFDKALEELKIVSE